MRGWVIRADVEHLPRSTRAKKTLRLWWSGPPGMTRPRPVLARLPAPVRHRAHHQVPKGHPGMNHPVAAAARAGGPLDRDHHRQLRPAGPGQAPRRRPALPWERPRDPARLTPRPGPPRLSPGSRAAADASQSQKNPAPLGPDGPRAVQPAQPSANPRSRKPHNTHPLGLKRKLRASRARRGDAPGPAGGR